MSNEISRLDALQIVSKQVGEAYTAEQIGVIQKSVAKDTTFPELAYFLNVCKTMDLNPFNKEVWCYKDNRGNLLIFSGRDGFLSKAQKNPLFNGIRSAVVHQNDEFKMNIATGEVSHFPDFKSDRGAIIGAYAIVFRKNGEPTIEWAEWSAYNKGYNAWKTHPQEMIKKVAETHALKKAFGISGIQSQYEYDIKDGAAVPKGATDKVDKDHNHVKSFIENAKNGGELAQVPQEKLDKYADLQSLYDQRMDEFLTQETEAHEIQD